MFFLDGAENSIWIYDIIFESAYLELAIAHMNNVLIIDGIWHIWHIYIWWHTSCLFLYLFIYLYWLACMHIWPYMLSCGFSMVLVLKSINKPWVLVAGDLRLRDNLALSLVAFGKPGDTVPLWCPFLVWCPEEVGWKWLATSGNKLGWTIFHVHNDWTSDGVYNSI